MNADLERLSAALEGRFRLIGEVGRGGMALVLRAHDLRHDRPVAVKILRPEIATQVGAIRFLQEIRIESRLQHPNILPVLDSGEVDGRPYYIMPLIDGASLADRLAQERQLPVDEAVRIASQVGAALAHAHAQGIIHRDIKPENILLSAGQALVADFGIARAVASAGGISITSSGMVLGTPAYMSPEQGAGDGALDGRSDQYALACVVHQMLVGEPPFRGPTAQAVIARHALERPPSIAIVRPGVPAHVIAAVEKALSKAPADRFPTIAAFVRALEDPAAAWQAPGARRLRRWAAAVGGVAVLGIGWMLLRPDSPSYDANRVVVFPLEERGFAPGDSGAGYDVALTIIQDLEQSEPLRGYDGARRLPPNLRARYRLDGVVSRISDSTVVTLRLYDEAGDSLVAQRSARDATDRRHPYQLGRQALVPLLPRILDPGRQIDLSPLVDHLPGAVALSIQGDRQYREGKFGEALAFYRRAVEEDSTLVMAAVKGAQAASWINRHADAGTMAAHAIRGETTLPRRYGYFARGVAAYVEGAADSALAWFERALQDAPDWSEAHMAAGEVAYHLVPARALPDSFAVNAFLRAREVDPDFFPPTVHLAEIGLRRGDLAAVRGELDALNASRPDSAILRQFDLMAACVAGDLDALSWRTAALTEVHTVLNAALALAVGAAQPRCAEAAFRAVLGGSDARLHWGAFLGLHGILAAQRRTAELIAVTDSMVGSGTDAARALYLLDALAGLDVAAEARGFSDFLTGQYGDALERLGRTASGARWRWMLGSWWMRDGRATPVAEWHRVVRRIADSLGSRSADLYARGLDAQLRLARGDTTGALGQLRQLAPVAPRDLLLWDLGESLPVERLRWAALALATGQPAEAIRAASGFDNAASIVSLIFIPASLELRIRAAEALGRSDLVQAYRARQEELGAHSSQPAGGRR